MEQWIIDLIGQSGDTLGTVGIIVPLLWYFIRQNSKTNDKLILSLDNMRDTSEEILHSLRDLNNTIKNNDEHLIEQFSFIKKSTGKKYINRNQAIDMMKKAMLSGSYKKIDYLRQRLERNNLKERAGIIKVHIKTELLKLSDEEYLTFLNGFTYNGYLLGDLIRKHFDFDNFLEEVYDSFFEEGKDVEVKLNNILSTMKSYQSQCIEDIKQALG